MIGVVREGWYEDPARRHEYRWFSAGTPTELVRDGSGTSRDPLSVTDPSLYQTKELGRPPGDSPLLRPAHPEHAQPVSRQVCGLQLDPDASHRPAGLAA
jgi:hypothetical protein